jgi:hypothetical protein
LRGTTVGSIALAHELGDDGALQQVGAELGEDAALGVSPTGGAPDALQAAGDGLRDSTCSTRSTAPMSMPAGDDVATRHGTLAGLEHLLDAALLARGAVVRSRSPPSQLVERSAGARRRDDC